MSERKKGEMGESPGQEVMAGGILTLLNNLPCAIYRGLRDWSITIMTEEVKRITGYPSGDFTGGRINWKDRIYPEDLEMVKTAFRQAVGTGKHFIQVQYRFIHRDGSIRWFEDNRHMVYDAKGSFEYVDGFIQDITDRKNTERAIRENEMRLLSLIGSIDEIVFEFDAEGTYLNIWTKNEDLLVRPREELLGRKIREFFTEDFDRQLLDVIKRVLTTGSAENIEYAIDVLGGKRWFLGRISPVSSLEGIFRSVCFVARDITERKEAEEELQDREMRFREMADNIREVFWLFDWDSQKVIYASPAYEEIWGRPVTDLYDRYEEWAESIHPDDLTLAEKSFADILETGGGEQREYRIIRPDGEIRWISDRGFAIRERDGRIKRITGIAEDVTDRKLAEEALKESEEKYRSVVEESLVGVYIIQDDIFRFVNDRLCKIFGYQSGELLGKLGPEDLTHPEDRRVVSENIKRRLDSEVESIEYEFRGQRKGGEVFPVKVLGKKSMFQGRPAIKGTLIDLSKEKALEEKYLQSQKMEAIGRLAGGIAHDINNYLGAITGFAELVKMQYDGQSLLLQKMDDILNSTSKASSLIDQLLAFSKKQPARPEPVNLNRIIKSLKKMMERLIGEDIVFTTALAPDLDNTKIDPSQMEQILVNLLINARDAMAGGGKVMIETANTDFDPEYLETHPEARPGRYVTLSVSDTGTGIPDKIRDKIFEPFFTTKNKDTRSGLGLATVHGIVEQNGGFIRVKSDPGRGSTISINLPFCGEEETEPSLEIPREPLEPAGSGKILFVEDDEDVRKSSTALLTAMGYNVIIAASGGEALELFEEEGSDVDLIITDVVMPGMSGRKLTEEIFKKQKEIAVLFISGYDDKIISNHGVLPERIHFLKKPYLARDLSRKIKEILHSASP